MKDLNIDRERVPKRSNGGQGKKIINFYTFDDVMLNLKVSRSIYNAVNS
jgi:hypothetical protein